jgi:hypothetical protein
MPGVYFSLIQHNNGIGLCDRRTFCPLFRMQRSVLPSEADILHRLPGNFNVIILRAHILKAPLLERAWMIVHENHSN